MKKNALIIIFLFVYTQIEALNNNEYNEWISAYEQTESFIIRNTENLMTFSRLINKGEKDFEGKTVILRPSSGDSISISTNSWIPLGTEDTRFMGTFDGEGHTISGLWIDAASDFVGFFHSIGSAGKVKDLNIVIADKGIKGGNRVGGLAGACYGEISNCSVKRGKIEGLGFSIGGLTGSAYPGSSIKGCSAETPVNATNVNKLHIGGLVGYLDRGTISDSHAKGTVNVKKAITSDMGGLVGYQKEGVISKCFATGLITVEKAQDSTIGGLVGKQCDQIDDQCYSCSQIICIDIDDSKVGKLVGHKMTD